jgi:hypothetical protein
MRGKNEKTIRTRSMGAEPMLFVLFFVFASLGKKLARPNLNLLPRHGSAHL